MDMNCSIAGGAGSRQTTWDRRKNLPGFKGRDIMSPLRALISSAMDGHAEHHHGNLIMQEIRSYALRQTVRDRKPGSPTVPQIPSGFAILEPRSSFALRFRDDVFGCTLTFEQWQFVMLVPL